MYTVNTLPGRYYMPSQYFGEKEVISPLMRAIRNLGSDRAIRSVEYFIEPYVGPVSDVVRLAYPFYSVYNQLRKIGATQNQAAKSKRNNQQLDLPTNVKVEYAEEQLELDREKIIQEQKNKDRDDAVKRQFLSQRHWIDKLMNIDTSRSSSAKPSDDPSIPELEVNKFTGKKSKSDKVTPGEVNRFVSRAVELIRNGDDINKIADLAATYTRSKTIKYVTKVVEMLKNPDILQQRYRNNLWVPKEIEDLVLDAKNEEL